jgi:hypothetical protein
MIYVAFVRFIVNHESCILHEDSTYDSGHIHSSTGRRIMVQGELSHCLPLCGGYPVADGKGRSRTAKRSRERRRI